MLSQITQNAVQSIIVIVLFCLSVLSHAQEKTSALLEQNFLSQSPACHFTGSFTQSKYLAGLAQPARSTGQFLYHCQYGVIWATTDPAKEILVLRSAKSATAYRIIDGEQQRMTSRQSKFLTQLVMSLIAGDQSTLNKHFEILPRQDQLTLTPKKRAIKRAIKQIVITPLENEERTDMKIEIMDRNEQITELVAAKNPAAQAGKTETSKDVEALLSECVASGLGDKACNLLLTDTQYRKAD